MNDVDRFLDQLGPEHADFLQLREAARQIPEITPEEAERLERDFFARLDARERARREARARTETNRRVRRATMMLATATLVTVSVAAAWTRIHSSQERDAARVAPVSSSAGGRLRAPTGAADAGTGKAPGD
jgi:hypothetical protein